MTTTALAATTTDSTRVGAVLAAMAVMTATLVPIAPGWAISRAELLSEWAHHQELTRGLDRAEAQEMTGAFLDGITDADVVGVCREAPAESAEVAHALRGFLGARVHHAPPDVNTIVDRLNDLSLDPECHAAYLRSAQRRVDVLADAEADAIARALLALADARPESEVDYELSAVAFGTGDAVLARITTYLTSRSDSDRRRGAELALRSRDERLGPVLIGVLERIVHDPAPFADSRDVVAAAAAERSGGESLPLLAQMIGKHTDWTVQAAGLDALGRTNVPRAYRVLARLYREARALAGTDDEVSAALHRAARRLESAGIRALRQGLVAEARDVVDVLEQSTAFGPCVRPRSVTEALKDYLLRDAEADTDRVRAIVERINASR